MTFEAYYQTEKKYQAEIHRLDVIAYDVYNSDRGSFLKAQADAWTKADPMNKRILQAAWSTLVVKYDLDKEADEVE